MQILCFILHLVDNYKGKNTVNIHFRHNLIQIHFWLVESEGAEALDVQGRFLWSLKGPRLFSV